MIISIYFISMSLTAQEMLVSDSAQAEQQKQNKQVDVNFLFSYYDQEGNHSAVTGGVGTEELKDYASKIILNVPLDSAQDLSVSVHVNYYSSASTDRINENMSSASSKDIHSQVDIAYSKRNSQKERSVGLIAGGSVESDYISGSIGFKWVKTPKDNNSEFALQAMAHFDAWQLIFPDELRATAYKDVTTDKRRSFSLSMTYSRAITKRLQASLTTDFAYQNGLLSTPFHRVYFKGSDVARVEKLPASRVKFPIGMRINYFLGEYLVTRLQYRFYYDNFGIIASTFNIELPFMIQSVFSISPFYRFHVQTAADYFKEYGLHEPGDLYYTSDFDLSSFTDHKVGLGLGYSPQAGKHQLKQAKKLLFNHLGIRYANYFRSDGLRAFVVSVHLQLKIQPAGNRG